MDSDPNAVVKKRLHIAGLTPAVSASDLSQRLGTFGTVIAVDGVGALDGLGRPRPFAYVTIEAKNPQLARCMNLLSGTTWKGAKLRIGEAKPDFRERIKRENEEPPDDRPTKKRRLPRGVQGIHASDMSLVTPENASSRPGWRVTPMGRVVRPIRMRPGKPLPPVSAVASNTTGKKEKKKRKREKAELVRARRRTIDPTKWNSQHLKGAFLDSIVVADDGDNPPATTPSKPDTADDQEGSDVSSDKGEDEEQEDESDPSEPEPVVAGSPTAPKPTDRFPPTAHIERGMVDTDHDFNQEKLCALSLLDSMFGGLEGDKEWGGKETLDSDVDMPELPPVQTPSSSKSSPSKEMFNDSDPRVVVEEAQKDSESEESSAGTSTTTPERAPESTAIQKNANTKGKLKDLFAPQEEQDFSLLNQLDLDLELEDEEPFPTALLPPVAPVAVQPPTVAPSSTTRVSLPHAQITLDASQPLFFPLSAEERANKHRNPKLKDIMDVFKEKGLDPKSTGFYRTESSEEIVKRWEAVKGDLTRDWKRRHREAVKSRRRRGGVDGD
ncbi:hypothetical protein BDM02DRAFT_3179499 [Thelephora ganbajun]|uniref:Uncharacterized protein n=1 Tax=Thelephora ganbajun TaxID=370292 RepID=A0ACB6ZJH4_THEGA|nr:hypothetical protein BDM02DRAFT_3179499 [Thelephora ganbajun]